MNTNERIRCLEGLDLFAAFAADDLQELAVTLKELRVPAGTTLCREGDPGREMYILLGGALRVMKQNRTIATLLPVDYVGEMAIIDTKPRSATVVATLDADLLVLSADHFRRYLARQPQSLVTLTRSLSRRVRMDTQTLAAEFEKANILVHDMRNMLSVFMLLGTLAKEVDDTGTAAKQIAFMQKARENLAALMDEALANAKRQQYAAGKKKNAICDLIEEVVSCDLRVHPDVEDKNIVLELDPKTPDFPFNALEIRRVLVNLVVNAAQASAAGGVVELACVAHENEVVVRIRDYGVGIPLEDQDKIFAAHFTTRESGTGLGLAACRQIIVQKHGGTLTCQSEPGEGATFCFTLPYAQED